MSNEKRCYCAIIEIGSNNKIKSPKLENRIYDGNTSDKLSYVLGLRKMCNPWNKSKKGFMSEELVVFGGKKIPSESVQRTLSCRMFIESYGQCILPTKRPVKMKLWYSAIDKENKIHYKFYLVSSESLLGKRVDPNRLLMQPNQGIVRIKHDDLRKYISEVKNDDFDKSYTKKFLEGLANCSKMDTVNRFEE